MSLAAGFAGAPVVKGLLFTVGTLSVATGVFGGRHLVNLFLTPHLTRDKQFWRLITSQLVWKSTGELLFGGLILYNQGRLIERQYSSAKFASFATIVTALTAVFELSFLFLFRPWGIATISPGPYGIAWGCLIAYLRDVPATYRVRMGGIGISDKWFPGVIALQLLLSAYPFSIYSSACGLLAGLTYKFLLPESVTRWRFPPRVRAFASSALLPLLDPPPSAANLAGAGRSSHPNFAQQGGGNQGGLPPPPAAASARPPPDPQQIAFLVAMGFQREAAIAALRETDNDANAAAEILLTRSS